MRRIASTVALGLCLALTNLAEQTNLKIPSSPTPRYDLRIRILPDERLIEVSGIMRLAAANIDRKSLDLSLSELMEEFRAEVVSPAICAGEARLEKSVRPYSRPGWGTATWKIIPPHPIPANQSVLLRFSYAGGGERTGFIFNLNREASFGAGLNTAWYPEVEESSVQSTGRLRGLRGTGTLNFSVPPGYIVHAQGIERSTLKEISQGSFRFQIDYPVFFSFAAGRYTVHRKSGTLPVAINLLRPRSNTSSYINGAARVLDVLTREFGHYPHSKFAVVEVPTEAGDQAGFAGASVDGFIIVNSEFLDKDFNTAYFGHEIGHQWWGNLIRTKGLEGLWILSEAMAQYGSLRAVEVLEGERAAAQYRRTGYPGYIEDQNARGYFALLKRGGEDHRLSDLPTEGNSSRLLSDSKGFIVLDMLSREIGRERFNRILQNFIRKNAYRRVNWSDFLSAIQTGANKNLRWFFEQWFERTGAPDYQLDWKQKGNIVSGKITQPAPYYRATLEVEIVGANNRRMLKTAEIIADKIDFNWRVPFKVKSVVLDPHYKVLRWLPEFRLK